MSITRYEPDPRSEPFVGEFDTTVGIEAGSLYSHISSKQDLLFQLIQKATNDLIVTVSR